MIHVRITAGEMHISITEESLPQFTELVNRALNCWDNAPKDLKILGDMITHGRITQDHTYQKITFSHNADKYSSLEHLAIQSIRAKCTPEEWKDLMNGDRVELHKRIKDITGS